MNTEETDRFPRSWSEMSFDAKLFFAFYFCIFVMFVSGGALSASTEVSIALGLATIAIVASLFHRYRKGWRWRGAGLKQALGALGGVALAGLMFVAVGQFGTYADSRLLSWFIAGTGIAGFNALVSLRLVRASEAEFLADARWNTVLNCDNGRNLPSVAPRPRAINVVRNAIAGALTAYGFVSFCIFFWLDERWIHLAPSQAVPAQGLIYMHNEHGSYVYFSAFQATACALIFGTSIPLAFIGVLVAPKKNVQKAVRWYAARMTWDKDDPAGVSDWAFWITALLTPPLVFFVGPLFVVLLNKAGFVANLG